jgi:hypothetical protein
MTRIGDNIRPVLETALAQAAARRRATEAARRRAELDWRRTLHPERDPFAARPAGGWSAETAAARERFRRAHIHETRARDAEAALALELDEAL